MSRWFVFTIPLVLFLLVGSFLWRGLSLNPQHIPSPLIGKSMPSFHLPMLNTGEIIHSDDLLGQPFLLNVWASWCVTCRFEHKFLMTLSQEIPIIGWNYKDDLPAAQQWLASQGNPYEKVLIDREGRAAIDWGIYGTPETFLIDSQGIVRYKHVGPMNQKVWKTQFLPLLGE